MINIDKDYLITVDLKNTAYINQIIAHTIINLIDLLILLLFMCYFYNMMFYYFYTYVLKRR